MMTSPESQEINNNPPSGAVEGRSPDPAMSKRERIQAITVGLVLAGVGVLAVRYPDALAELDAAGRRPLLRLLLSWAWGRVGGSLVILLGGLVIVGALLPDKEKTTPGKSL